MNRLFNAISNSKEVYFYIFAFGLVAHGFVFFNEVYSYDSLIFDHNYAIGLGRWGQSIVFFLRGQVFPPTLIGFLALFFLASATAIFLDLFNITCKITQIIICGTLVTSYTFTAIASTFMFYLDVNMLSIMFVMLSCHFLKKCSSFRNKLLLGSTFLMMSLSLYQVYLQLYTLVCGLFFFFDLLNDKPYKKLMNDAFIYFLVMFAGLLLYKLSLPISLKISSIHELSTSYNTVTKVGMFDSLWQIFVLFVLTVPYELRHLLFGVTYLPAYLVSLLVLICILIGAILIYKKTKNSLSRMLFSELMFLFAIPFFSNVVYIISKGLMHDLMRFSYTFVSLVPILVISNLKENFNLFEKNKISEISSVIISIVMSILIFSNIIFSNQIYLKKELESKSSLSFATRIASRIEELPNFKFNSTKVCFVGKPSQNKYMNVTRIPIPINNSRMSYDFNLAFEYYPSEYFRNILGIKYVICDISSEVLNVEKAHMPIFPLKGSIIQEQDRVYVKLGNSTLNDRIASIEKDEICVSEKCSISFNMCINALKYKYSKLK